MLPFETVRELLLRAGITPRHARRYVTELREHLADLTQRERASGLDSQTAAARALSLVGSDAELARAMIDKGTHRSVAARAPWAIFALSPALLLLALVWAIDFSMMHLLWPVRTLAPSEMPESYRVLIQVVGFVANYLIGALLAAGCIVGALRQRLASAWVWIGLSVIAVLSGNFGFHTHVFAPAGGHMGGHAFGAVDIVYLHGRPNVAATFGLGALHAAVLFVIAATVYYLCRMRIYRE